MAVYNYIREKGKEKKYNNIQKETPYIFNSSTGSLLFENRLKLQLEVYTTNFGVRLTFNCNYFHYLEHERMMILFFYEN